jgi:hypothetical protein
MELFLELLAEKGEHMAMPDVLVAGVGTRIYHNEGGYSRGSSGGWREDKGWRQQMDQDWDLQAGLRGVAEAMWKVRGLHASNGMRLLSILILKPLNPSERARPCFLPASHGPA